MISNTHKHMKTTLKIATLLTASQVLAGCLFTLPPAVIGLEYFFYVGAVQDLVLDGDAAETIGLPSTGAPVATITANAIGESVHIKCIATGIWTSFGSTGTWA